MHVTELSLEDLGSDSSAVRSLIAGLPIPAIAVEVETGNWHVLVANDLAIARLGLDASPAGLTLHDLLTEQDTVTVDGLTPAQALHEVLRTRATVTTRVLVAEAPEDKGLSPRWWSLHLQPVLGVEQQSVRAILISVLDLTASIGSPALSAGSAALQSLAAGLTATKPIEEVYSDVISSAVIAADGSRGVLLAYEAMAGFRVLRSVGEAPSVGDGHAFASVSLHNACTTGERVMWSATDPGAGPPPLSFAGTPGWEQLLLVGLRLESGVPGAIAVGQPRHGTFDTEALERLGLVATLASTAVENVRLVDEFARFEELLSAAVEASAGLVEVRDPLAARRRLLDGLVDGLGFAGAALWAREPGRSDGLELVGAIGLPDEVRRRVGALGPASVANRLLRAVEEGTDVDPPTSSAPSSWADRQVRLVTVPEPASGVLGVYAERPLPRLVDRVLVTLTHAFASAVGQATLHERVATVVDSLQRELRPHRAVSLPGADVGHVYRSATVGMEVGGDFFDIFSTESGHVGLACGDVSGKGVEAASLTAMAVYSLRAFALPGASPRTVVSMVNGVVADQTGDERFMTLAYARIDPVSWKVELTLAGHPPPLIVAPEGVRTLPVAPGLPVGIERESTFAQQAFTLAPDEAIVLYTDGVTEARCGDDPGELWGVERAIDALTELHGHDAQGLADGLWEAVERWTAGGTLDDCAIVVLRRS